MLVIMKLLYNFIFSRCIHIFFSFQQTCQPCGMGSRERIQCELAFLYPYTFLSVFCGCYKITNFSVYLSCLSVRSFIYSTPLNIGHYYFIHVLANKDMLNLNQSKCFTAGNWSALLRVGGGGGVTFKILQIIFTEQFQLHHFSQCSWKK